MKTAVLFLSHIIHDSYLQRYHKLVNELGAQYEVYWVFQADNGISEQPLIEQGVNIFCFTTDKLNQLNYTPIAETLVPGSVHFITALFFREHPNYDFYWTIEYDVVFTGNWSVLFDVFQNDDADLLASHIEFRNVQNIQWTWWKSLSIASNNSEKMQEQLKCFAPIYRLSKCALVLIDKNLQQDGYSGHMEVLLPTLLYRQGLILKDFGGTGAFTPPELRNRFYVQGSGINNGTMRWRPIFLSEEVNALGTKEKLFHPVKW